MIADEASGPPISHPIVVGGPEFTADPHRHHSWLRRHAPVYRGRISHLPDREAYLVSGYHDCVRVLTCPGSVGWWPRCRRFPGRTRSGS